MSSQSGKTTSKIISALTKLFPEKKRDAFSKIAATLFASVSAEDLAAHSPRILVSILGAAEKVLSGKSKASLAVDELGDDHTLVTLTMTNRPFIVDSVLAELAQHCDDIQLVVHPVIDHKTGTPLSLMQVLFEAVSKSERQTIEGELETVMEQIQQVTDDWKPMLNRMETVVAQFRETPPPIPAENLAETIQFVEWICANNFTLMGLQELNYEGNKKSGKLTKIEGSSLGILRNDAFALMTKDGEEAKLTPQIREFLFKPNTLIITKANAKSRVHRRTYLDYIGIKRYTSEGKLAGELRVVGLFTSTAYNKSVMTIPVLRHKVEAIIEASHAERDSHSGKALINILETWPRDEMFQADLETLENFANSAVRLEERPRVTVLARADEFDRFASVIVYVPRDRYSTDVRLKIGDYLSQSFDGHVSAFFPTFLENGLTRVHFIIGRGKGKTPHVDREELETAVKEITRTWEDRLAGLNKAASLHVFPSSYQDEIAPDLAVQDSKLFSPLEGEQAISFDFHDVSQSEEGNRIGLKLFHLNSAVPLSDRVPLLENLGFRVIEESTYEITRADGLTVFAHDMMLESASGTNVDPNRGTLLLEQALNAVWEHQTDNDSFNALVLNAGLSWQMVSVFRAYARYLRQIRSSFSIESMAETLLKQSTITADLVRLFEARFGLTTKARGRKEKAAKDAIREALEQVTSSDEDTIIRRFMNLINSTLRTNYYSDVLVTEGTEEAPTPVLAFKVDPSLVTGMPQPIPYREIFVSSPLVEGLHLRFGPVARGGLRWSDRAQDYRTEVLGLVKAQQVKNAVIVPVGSKGGFVPKQLPDGSDRNAWFEAGRHAYKVFITSLLSLTDNLVDGEVVPPANVIRHDGDDPYFVVAADKGTSTFSDTANAISQAKDFWLDDAFASGGSAGYDHKKMGITARGGWEAVKRHFREENRDIQNEPFTAAGVGDMSGDVFGNGMLLSKQTLLVAAFDHRDIFIDPTPDAATSFKERDRLFNMGRSSWQDYNADLISKGGGIFPRSSKRITLSKRAADAIGFTEGEHTPQAVLNAILKAPVDLMWFGGIGTYIRASHESNADAGDRGNDPIRVTSKELRCKVIGEGANLGVTHPARIEYNFLGGKCNSDAIDNSAGVNSSDVEVNIKIALAAAMKTGRLTRPKRDKLLESMTASVAELVLRNNYQQTLAISLTALRGMEDFPHQQRLMQNLEGRNLLDRAVEDLPDDALLAERQATNAPLTRAEVGVLLAYAKIVALDDLISSDVPDDPYLNGLLVDYFPPKMQKPYFEEINTHRLRREIIATGLANSMINRGGPTFLIRVADHTGASISRIARAYAAVRDAFRLTEINAAIDALDTKIDGSTQLELYKILQDRVLSQTIWFVRYGDFSKGIEAVSQSYRSAVDALSPKLEKILPDFLSNHIELEAERFGAAGVPKALARILARMPIAGLIPDILFASQQSGQSLDKTATAFFSVTDVFRVGRMVQAARNLTSTDYYDGLALDRALQSLHRARRDIVVDILNGKSSKNPTTAWLKSRSNAVERTRSQIDTIMEHDHATVSRLTVAANILADLARG